MDAAGAVHALERLFLPNACVGCDRLVEPARPDALLCGLCRSRLRPLTGGCVRCRQPLPPVGPCRFCADWESLQWAYSAVWHVPPARQVVHALKYEGLPRLAEECADAMRRLITRPRRALLVPVPLGTRRRRERGYNQAAAIARALARHWGLPVAEGMVRRTRETRSQTALTPEERTANVAGSFAAAPPPTSLRDSAPGGDGAGTGRDAVAVILVDDVLTTGATLQEAAQSLRSAGWPAVGALTFARAVPYELRLDERPPAAISSSSSITL